MKKILLTGALGFTGVHFTTAALAAGFTVHALQSDLLDAGNLQAEVLAAEPNFVVHLAAISFVGHGSVADFYRVNVEGSENLLKACLALTTKPSKILMASSANIYGNCEVSPIPETQLPSPANHYAASKLAMEHMCQWYQAQLPIVITRPFNYTGLGQAEQFLIPKICAHFASLESKIELGNLNVYREYNDVRWLVAAYLALLENGGSGQTYNLCSGLEYSLLDVIERCKELTKHSIQVSVNPKFVRHNEITRLSGNPSRLKQTLTNIDLPSYSIDNTLSWMLNIKN